MMSLHSANVSVLHYNAIMLGKHNYITFHYANAIMLLYLYVYR